MFAIETFKKIFDTEPIPRTNMSHFWTSNKIIPPFLDEMAQSSADCTQQLCLGQAVLLIKIAEFTQHSMMKAALIFEFILDSLKVLYHNFYIVLNDV